MRHICHTNKITQNKYFSCQFIDLQQRSQSNYVTIKIQSNQELIPIKSNVFPFWRGKIWRTKVFFSFPLLIQIDSFNLPFKLNLFKVGTRYTIRRRLECCWVLCVWLNLNFLIIFGRFFLREWEKKGSEKHLHVFWYLVEYWSHRKKWHTYEKTLWMRNQRGTKHKLFNQTPQLLSANALFTIQSTLKYQFNHQLMWCTHRHTLAYSFVVEI